jgi:hypothetical protein
MMQQAKMLPLPKPILWTWLPNTNSSKRSSVSKTMHCWKRVDALLDSRRPDYQIPESHKQLLEGRLTEDDAQPGPEKIGPWY